MTTDTSLRQLGRDWPRLAGDKLALEAAARWAGMDARLAGCGDLDAVLARCHDRRDRVAGNAALAALLRLADVEPLAGRVALQALLPGLTALTVQAREAWRRHGVCPGDGDLEQEIVGAAWEQVHRMAGRDVRYPALRILGEIWRRQRRDMWNHRRRAEREFSMCVVPLMGSVEAQLSTSGLGASWEQETAWLLRDAVDAGVLDTGSGALIFATRVLGHSAEQIAAQRREKGNTLRERRRRGERALRAALLNGDAGKLVTHQADRAA